MVSSLITGMGCGLLSFAALRYRRIQRLNSSFKGGGGSGRTTSKYYGRSNPSSSSSSSSNSSGGYAFDPPPPPPYNNGNSGSSSKSTAGSRLGFVIDVVLSTSLGLLTSLLVFESDIFYPQPAPPILSSSRSTNNNNDTATTTTNDDDDDNSAVLSHPILPPQWISPIIPLVPGRSILADTLCGPLTNEFRKFPKEFWQGGSRNIGIENGYNNHMGLYANMGWRGTKYYQQQQHQHHQQQYISKQKQQLHDNVNIEILGENPTDLNYNEIGTYERLVLDNLQGFVINCERRSRHEAKLRKLRYPKRGGLLLGSGSRGGSGNGRNSWSDQQQQQLSPVVIPDEGVFADEDLELDDIYFVNDNDESE